MLLPEAENDYLARVLNGQRPKQQGIDQTENRGVRADAQREGEHRDGGESGIFAQHTQSEAHILQKRF